MASRRGLAFGFGFHSKPNYIFPASETPAAAVRRPEPAADSFFEFDEADIWGSGQTLVPESRKMGSISKKFPKRSGGAAAEKPVKAAASSLPVNIPDWSKILQSDRSRQGQPEAEEDSDGEGEEIRRAPPHEYLARRRGDSFSVHEGIGRTLKGRDLRMVRNAIWEKTGFQD